MWSAARTDTAGKLGKVISRPGGAPEISRWWSEAPPPGQRAGDSSRPGRDAALALIIVLALVQRPSRAPLVGDGFPAASPPANFRRAFGAEEFASSISPRRTPHAPRFRPRIF